MSPDPQCPPNCVSICLREQSRNVASPPVSRAPKSGAGTSPHSKGLRPKGFAKLWSALRPRSALWRDLSGVIPSR